MRRDVFSRAVELGRALRRYNGGRMRRDFTYVDDIVAGIEGAMGFCHRAPSVFNLGNNEPVGVLDFIRVIERVLKKRAVLTYKNSTSEIDATYADISKAKRLLQFSPRTSIDRGWSACCRVVPQRAARGSGMNVSPSLRTVDALTASVLFSLIAG